MISGNHKTKLNKIKRIFEQELEHHPGAELHDCNIDYLIGKTFAEVFTFFANV